MPLKHIQNKCKDKSVYFIGVDGGSRKVSHGCFITVSEQSLFVKHAKSVTDTIQHHTAKGLTANKWLRNVTSAIGGSSGGIVLQALVMEGNWTR